MLERIEIIERLKALSKTDMVRLGKVAAHHCLGSEYTPDDLLNEAIRRMLDGTREVPREQPFMACLCENMRSIASASRKHERTLVMESIHADVEAETGGREIPSPDPTPEQVVMSHDSCAKLERQIIDLFNEDEEALMVLMGKLDGLEPGAIQQLLGIDDKMYATALRRIRRTIDKKFPQGWKP